MKNKIIAILKDISKQMNIQCPQIEFSDGVEIGMYFPSDNRIVLPTSKPFVNTLFIGLHELRHSYQGEYVKRRKDELSMEFEMDMIGYGVIPYEYLVIEQEAYAFAYYVIVQMLHMEIELSDMVRKMISSFEKKYQLVFSVFL